MDEIAALNLIPILKNIQIELEQYNVRYGHTVRMAPQMTGTSTANVPSKQRNIDFILNISKQLANYCIIRESMRSDYRRRSLVTWIFEILLLAILGGIAVAVIIMLLFKSNAFLVLRLSTMLLILMFMGWISYVSVKFSLGYQTYIAMTYNVKGFENNGNTVFRLLKILQVQPTDNKGRYTIADGANPLYRYYFVDKYKGTVLDDSVKQTSTEEEGIADSRNFIFPFDGDKSIDPFILKKDLNRFDIFEQRVLMRNAFAKVNQLIRSMNDVIISATDDPVENERKARVTLQRRSVEILMGLTLPPRPANDDYRGLVVVTKTPDDYAAEWQGGRNVIVSKISEFVINDQLLVGFNLTDVDVVMVIKIIDDIIGGKDVYEGVITDIMHAAPVDIDNRRLEIQQDTYISYERFVEKVRAMTSLTYVKYVLLPFERIRASAESVVVFEDIYDPTILSNTITQILGTSLIFGGFLIVAIILVVSLSVFGGDNDISYKVFIVASVSSLLALAYAAMWTMYHKRESYAKFQIASRVLDHNRVRRIALKALRTTYDDIRDNNYGIRNTTFNPAKAAYLKENEIPINPYYQLSPDDDVDVPNDVLFEHIVNSCTIDTDTYIVPTTDNRLYEIYTSLVTLSKLYKIIETPEKVPFPWTEFIGYSVIMIVTIISILIIIKQFDLITRIKRIAYIGRLKRLFYSNNRNISDSDMTILQDGISQNAGPMTAQKKTMYALGSIMLVIVTVFFSLAINNEPSTYTETIYTTRERELINM